MSLIAQKISGCYRRVLVFFVLFLFVGAGLGFIVYYRVGGMEGLRYWTAIRALNGTEKLILKNRPEGIPQERVKKNFETVREAIHSRLIELDSLYKTLNTFAIKFRTSGLTSDNKPSTPKVKSFLTELEDAVITEE